MSLLYSYGTGSSASADRYSTVDELLGQLPDNTANLIVPQDLRDSVFTLWERIGDVELIAASAASASAFFQNSDPTPVTVGGIPSGSTFPTPTDMQTMWNQLLYPYIPPTSSLSIVGSSTREYGNTLGLNANSITLNWSVTRNTSSNLITTITVDGAPQIPTGTSQAGTKTTNGTHSWVSTPASQTNTFTMSGTDDYPTAFNSNTTLTWMNRIYWGRIDLSSIGNPNLTTNPGSASLVDPICSDATILNLTGAGVGSGNQLSSSKDKTYTNINGAGWYLIFAWPSSVSGATAPSFEVNGLPNTAFTRVRTASPFVGLNGFTTNFEVWVSNTLQNSPLNIVIS
jgi:hypothetical protein